MFKKPIIGIINFVLPVLAAGALLAFAASAEVPHLINYQGRVTDDLGNPLNGTYWMTFSIWSSAEGGTMKWSSNPRASVEVEDGLFAYQLGSSYPLPEDIFLDSANWLEITVDGEVITPRTQLISVPYAYHARTTDGDGAWSIDGESVYHVDGYVGIGMSDPNTKLDVAGVIRILRDDDFSYPGEGEGMELYYDPFSRVGIIQVYDRPLGYRRLNIKGGNVGISVMDPQYLLDVGGSAHASSFPTSSDIRLKTNIKKLENVLDKLDRIQGVSFDWNETYESMGRSTGHREIGVIAQEVEEVFPELITTWSDEDYRAVDYGRLTAVLIEAVKELKAENAELKTRITALENQ